MANVGSVFTYELINSIMDIDETFNLTIVSVKLISGVGTISGKQSVPVFGTGSLNLVVGEPVTISTKTNSILTGININCEAGGVIQIVAE